MNTNPKHTADQLRLAATIIETGHPMEWQRNGTWYKCSSAGAVNFLSQGYEIRLTLATPPDNRPLHNPDNLDAEQVGAGYRLALPDEESHEDAERWEREHGVWGNRLLSTRFPYVASDTYRLPLSVPWPEPKPDPYAELKAAHAAGKVIQARAYGEWHDENFESCKMEDFSLNFLRIKPEEPFQLPPPPPGMRWHREDGWQADDLPQGYRPYVQGEFLQKGDEWRQHSDNKWQVVDSADTGIGWVPDTSHPFRTTRPLTFEHEGKTWTYHKPGDPMPCDGEREVVLLGAGPSHHHHHHHHHHQSRPDKGSYWLWQSSMLNCVGWRYAEPETKEVELGPDDVPPWSVFRVYGTVGCGWHQMKICPQTDCLIFSSDLSVSYKELAKRWQINRSLSQGQWNPDAWEPCKKTITIEKP